MGEDRFKQAAIATLAKRAANCCSNPDCGAITSGPTADPHDSVNVGEAAHIYGANPGSARYRSDMSSMERSAISNAIWLCGNCHKLIDDDATKYPAGLLFEWQRDHEYRISKQVGKASAEIRQRYEKRHLEEFGHLSYLAERLILEKGKLWEFRLTAEVLRFETAPVLKRWGALKRGLYIKSRTRIARSEFASWLSSKNSELLSITTAFGELTNVEFARAWGPPGEPGSDVDIVTVCRLFREMCQSALDWEESVRFVEADSIFDEIQALYVGVAGMILEEAAKLPAFLQETVADNPESGSYTLNLVLALPHGWADAVNSASKRAYRALDR